MTKYVQDDCCILFIFSVLLWSTDHYLQNPKRNKRTAHSHFRKEPEHKILIAYTKCQNKKSTGTYAIIKPNHIPLQVSYQQKCSLAISTTQDCWRKAKSSQTTSNQETTYFSCNAKQKVIHHMTQTHTLSQMSKAPKLLPL